MDHFNEPASHDYLDYGSDGRGDSENTDPNGDEDFSCSADNEDDFFSLNQADQNEVIGEEFFGPVAVEDGQDDFALDVGLNDVSFIARK